MDRAGDRAGESTGEGMGAGQRAAGRSGAAPGRGPLPALLVVLLAAWLGGCATADAFHEPGRLAQLKAQAEAGSAEAQFRLGELYCCGFGGGKDSVLARRWLCRAALQGHPGAQLALGQFFGIRPWRRDPPVLQRGNPYRLFRVTDGKKPLELPQAIAYAHYWYSRAARNGSSLAAHYAKALELDMTPAELARSRAFQRHPERAGCG